MLVRTGDRTHLEARAKAEAADNVLTRDFYTQRPQIRITGEPSRPAQPAPATEVILDGNDVAKLIECAIRHPTPNMRYAVLAAIWNHPETFRQLFRFGLTAPAALSEIRKVVAEELDKFSAAASSPQKPAGEPLLPAMPLPPHLRDRERK